MRIYVTKDDIAQGQPCNSGKCPIARSLRRRFPKAFVSVGPKGCMLGETLLELPKAAQRFVNRFDSNPASARPFYFSL